jgi:hypothetical protein
MSFFGEAGTATVPAEETTYIPRARSATTTLSPSGEMIAATAPSGDTLRGAPPSRPTTQAAIFSPSFAPRKAKRRPSAENWIGRAAVPW